MVVIVTFVAAPSLFVGLLRDYRRRIVAYRRLWPLECYFSDRIFIRIFYFCFFSRFDFGLSTPRSPVLPCIRVA